MSPDRILTTRAEAIRRRKEEEQKRLEKMTLKKVAVPQLFSSLRSGTKPEAEPKPTPKPKPALKVNMGSKSKPHNAIPVTPSRWNRHFEIAMSTPTSQAQVLNAPKAPTISFALPRIGFGPRWLSFFMAIFCAIDLYLMLTTAPFIVHQADILGNLHVSNQEIQNVLRIDNLPAAYIDPAQVQINVLAAFPDISSVQVDVNIPNNVVISVQERTPMAAWQQDGQIVWVDAQGYAFPPRGQVDNLPTITALGAAPSPDVDPAQTYGAKPFLQPDLSKAVVTLLSYLPQGAVLVFDPQYGLGWSDPQGWKVFFGQGNDNSTLKLQVYQSMLAYLTKKNIKPTLISVEYPNAPYYQVEQ